MSTLIDLFCGDGGAAMGYYKAGFSHIIGVDLRPGTRYPFLHLRDDWEDGLRKALAATSVLGGPVLIHASPPCQAYSITKHLAADTHPQLVEPVRAALQATGHDWVIENVPGAPLVDPAVLCGTMFGLTATDTDGTPLYLRRHRLFETSWGWRSIGDCGPYSCPRGRMLGGHGWRCGGAYGGGSSDKTYAREVRKGGYTPSDAVQRKLMGIDWMSRKALAQAIPPAYTQRIGGSWLAGKSVW
jgi:DNA (cytosine-5)-methyltransferase 1